MYNYTWYNKVQTITRIESWNPYLLLLSQILKVFLNSLKLFFFSLQVLADIKSSASESYSANYAEAEEDMCCWAFLAIVLLLLVPDHLSL